MKKDMTVLGANGDDNVDGLSVTEPSEIELESFKNKNFEKKTVGQTQPDPNIEV